ncbi:MAG: hypothetical protein JO250_12560 [Armatimonadetes bacterium]|nr:hypothetical protein [Armatimonadota bacterium]
MPPASRPQAGVQSPAYPEPALVWQNVVIAHGRVTQVGAQRLPYPISLPDAVRPLGGKAMVREGQEPNWITGSEMYFPVQDAGSLRRWAKDSASHFPVPLGDYRIVRKPDLHITHDTFMYRVVVRGKDTQVLLVVSTYIGRPTPGDPDAAIGGAWTSSDSPIKDEDTFIGVRVYYTRITARP